MIFTSGPRRAVVWLALLLGAAGCGPMADSSSEEQREAHFLNGKARVQAFDFNGAIEAFEKAVEVNPRNASAHFELGILYEQRANDFAAAIYHYERFLRQQPDSPHTETVRQRITACKQELARTVSLAPVTQSMQRDFERLAAENLQLKKQVEQLQELLGRRAAAPAAPLNLARNDSPPAALNLPVAPRATPAAAPDPPAALRARTYTVQKGDTPTLIAKKFNVKLDAFMAANPKLDPRRMQIGQTLNIPAP